jgi:hypothetical protein
LNARVTHTAGIVLLAGAAAFCAVAFAPASFVFGMSDAHERRAYLDRHARSWRWGQLPFAAGAVVSAVGLLVLGRDLDGTPGTAVSWAGGLAIVASLPWAEHCRLRALSAADFLDGRLPGWHFVVFVWGTLAALAVTGAALLDTDLPRWTAWFVLGSSACFAAAMLRFRDLPPFLLYVVTGVLGVAAL